jgi:hypothetical protein
MKPPAAEGFAKGHVLGAVNLLKEKWDTAQGLKKDEINVLCCYTQQCHLAANAALEFASRGFPVMEKWKAGSRLGRNTSSTSKNKNRLISVTFRAA